MSGSQVAHFSIPLSGTGIPLSTPSQHKRPNRVKFGWARAQMINRRGENVHTNGGLIDFSEQYILLLYDPACLYPYPVSRACGSNRRPREKEVSFKGWRSTPDWVSETRKC
jgi:hypothetical protein